MTLIRSLLLGAAFAASAFVASCSTTGTVDVTARISLPNNNFLEVSTHLDINGNKTLVITSSTTGCAQVCFTGPSGDLGCTIVEVPGSTPVPPGATDWSVSDVECPNGESVFGSRSSGLAGSSTSSAIVQGVQAGGTQKPNPGVPYPNGTWTFVGGKVVPAANGSKNVSYAFEIQASGPAQAKARRDMVLAGGIGTAVGTGFDVISYNEAQAEFDVTGFPTGVRMRQAEINDDFDIYRLTVNGNVFAELGATGNLLHYGASNGWNVVETFVPTSAFGTVPGAYDNQAEADWTTITTTIPRYAMQRVSTN